MAVHRRTALGITRTFQITNLFPNLTVSRNLVIACLALEMSKGTIVYSSSPQELWANQEVKYQYLGV
jgi:branched-chain amino acid transport system ATP-binding protein